jgi:hypothetical protein
VKRLAFLLLMFCSTAHAGNVDTTEEGKIRSIYAYDDYKNGLIFIHFTAPLAACPSGIYLKPSAVGFDHMYSLALMAFGSNKPVRFQLYTDRLVSSRCEADAVLVFAD